MNVHFYFHYIHFRTHTTYKQTLFFFVNKTENMIEKWKKQCMKEMAR